MKYKYMVVGWKSEEGREFAYSLHKTHALALARIRWDYQRRNPETIFRVVPA